MCREVAKHSKLKARYHAYVRSRVAFGIAMSAYILNRIRMKDTGWSVRIWTDHL